MQTRISFTSSEYDILVEFHKKLGKPGKDKGDIKQSIMFAVMRALATSEAKDMVQQVLADLGVSANQKRPA